MSISNLRNIKGPRLESPPQLPVALQTHFTCMDMSVINSGMLLYSWCPIKVQHKPQKRTSIVSSGISDRCLDIEALPT